jgi:hypothetical protein
MMKKMFAVVLLASAVVGACSSKKASTTPSSQAPRDPQENSGDATGGAMYGGNKAAAPTGKDTPNPCATK